MAAQLLPAALRLVLIAGSIAAASARELNEYNPAAVPVKEVHMVLSSHFDAGCKTPGCTLPEHMAAG